MYKFIMKRVIELFLMWTWELPQSLLGCIVLLFMTEKKDGGLYAGRRVIWFKKGSFFSGTSLGYWIILPYDSGVNTTAHEYGHCIQSRIYGLLYLFTCGVPSLLNNLKARKCAWTYENYYNLWPENNADKLGGVNRG